MSQPLPNKVAANRVILPLDGRADGTPAESVFSDHRPENISMVGEAFRKLTHMGALVIPIGYYFLGSGIVQICLIFALLCALAVEYIRLFGQEKAKIFVYRFMGIMTRPHEKKKLTGATYILLGSIITIALFDKPVALAAISFIIVGDTAGALIGRIWGKVRYRNKSLEGSISFFLACSVVAALVPGISFWVKIIGAIAATIVEAITLHIDDNLIVPITSAALMQVIISQLVVLEHFA